VKRGAEDENPADYIDPETPLGDKKQMSRQLAKQYNPTAVEKSWVLVNSVIVVVSCYYPSIECNAYLLLCYGLGGMSGGRNQSILWQMLAAQNHLLLLWVSCWTSSDTLCIVKLTLFIFCYLRVMFFFQFLCMY
jgi:hypothetical protein